MPHIDYFSLIAYYDCTISDPSGPVDVIKIDEIRLRETCKSNKNGTASTSGGHA